MSRRAVPSVCTQTTSMLPVTVAVLVVSDIASVMQPMPMFLVPVYTLQGTCGCWAYISICNHAWLVECGWSSAGLTTDPRKLVLATTGENWALEILSNDHIKNYFKMFHQALLLMDILEWKLSYACQIVITSALVMSSGGSRLGWRHIYLLDKCLCKKFYCVKSSNPATQQMVQDTINICSPWQSF